MRVGITKWFSKSPEEKKKIAQTTDYMNVFSISNTDNGILLTFKDERLPIIIHIEQSEDTFTIYEEKDND